MNKSVREELLVRYRNAKSKAILLDYDGTLINHTPVPETTILSEDLFEILIKLVEAPKTEVFIITGRGYKDIDKIMTHLHVNIIAEHGAMIKENGIWKNQISENDSWKARIFPILNQITLNCPNSFIEEKKFSLAWHYRNAEYGSGFRSSRELIRTLKSAILSDNLKIIDGNKIVEVMDRAAGKGNAVRKLYNQSHFEFILAIGDDATDEEMFEYLLKNANAITIKVGNGTTYAKNRLKGINDVLNLLKLLSL